MVLADQITCTSSSKAAAALMPGICGCRICHPRPGDPQYWLRQQQCGKSGPIAWELVARPLPNYLEGRVLSVAHQPTKGYRQNWAAHVDKTHIPRLRLGVREGRRPSGGAHRAWEPTSDTFPLSPGSPRTESERDGTTGVVTSTLVPKCRIPSASSTCVLASTFAGLDRPVEHVPRRWPTLRSKAYMKGASWR